MKVSALASGLGLIAVFGLANAQDAPSFAELDTDQDGQISAEEASINETVAAAFGDADANGDGMLSADEFASLVTQ